MRAPIKLGLYGTGLVGVFALAFVTAGAVVPTETVQAWSSATQDHSDDHSGGEEPEAVGGEVGQSGAEDHGSAVPVATGLSSESAGFRLTQVDAPTSSDVEGELALTVLGPDGQPTTDFDLSHEKELHLIVVGSDGSEFRHVHPERDQTGRWSIPWEWQAAGTYRVFADFVPAQTGETLTLSTMVQVPGEYDPMAAEPVADTTVDGFDVAVSGDLTAGEASTLTMTISRDGAPVTELEPYLGAFGHLVALRDGDLAYLHVHPHGDEPAADETSGPEVVFEVTAPTPGRYLLFLDFKVDGQVRTAPLVVDTTDTGEESGPSMQDTNSEHEEGEEHDH